MKGRWWSGLLGGGQSLRRVLRRSSPAAMPPAGMLAAAGSGVSVAAPKGYSPKNVGNDASARPWESLAEAAAPAVGTAHRSPEGFDAEGFLRASKSNFLSLQEAWDRSDIPSLRAMMTSHMLAEIQSQLAERERAGAGANRTEVVMLEAQLLGLEDGEDAYLASVEFSGLIREDPSAGPNPFRELWNITRPKSGDAGWLVAGVQALQ
ncbi:MAG: Tim44 domain-containing protein [Hydrogenophaga sp.]|uniref:Tim44 domain-containing protein n=1 Tax=Hydrogenophaga sp. TaxID=1904254 RepID=UPI001A4CA4EB|nr:Tim44 domain-containing protein [Hydrogenophaga sp.]